MTSLLAQLWKHSMIAGYVFIPVILISIFVEHQIPMTKEFVVLMVFWYFIPFLQACGHAAKRDVAKTRIFNSQLEIWRLKNGK